MFNRRGTLAVGCLATAMLMLDIAVVNTALPRVARDLHSGLTGLQWIVDAYTLGLATVVLTAGSLADRLGRRRVFLIGIGIFTGTSVVCALANSITSLDVARAVQGLGAALMFASSLAMIADAYPTPEERAGAFAIYGATIGASFALGPLIGGALTSSFSWRAVFYLNIPLGLAALVGTALWVRESREQSVQRMDLPGQLTLTSGLLLLVLALLRGNDEGWSSTRIIAELVGSGVLLAAFLFIERASASPMLPLGLFRIPAFAGAQIAAFSISASFFALFVYMTLYLQDVLGLSPVQAGLVYLPSTGTMFIASAVTAQLLRRVTPGALVTAGLALVSLGLGLGLLAGTESSWVATLPGLVIAGVGTGFFNPAGIAVALGSVPHERSGLAAGVNDTFRNAGIAVGVALFGALIPAAHALGGHHADVYVTGYHHALITGCVIAAVGSAFSAYLIGIRRHEPSPHLAVSLLEPA